MYYSSNNILASFKKYTLVVLVISCVIQNIVFAEINILFCTVVVLFSWLLVSSIVLNSRNINLFPISTLVIFGFAATQLIIPTCFTLLEGKSLIYNLKNPVNVFIHIFLLTIVLVSFFLLYTRSNLNNIFPFRKFLYRMKFYESPSDYQVWFLGFIGLTSLFYIYYYIPSNKVESVSSSDRFIQGFISFAYAPYFLYVKELYGGKMQKIKNGYIFFFTFFLFIVSIGSNSRGQFMYGFTALGISYFWGVLSGKLEFTLLNNKKLIVAIIVGVFIVVGPLEDLATAMVIVRSKRNEVSRTELVLLTLKQLGDRDQLDRFKSKIKSKSNDTWDEHYFNNLYLARFSNLKYNDLSLTLADKIPVYDNVMLDYSLDKIIVILPQSFISFLGLQINKENVINSSFGDILYFRATRFDNILGGFRSGHIAGTGIASFGWLYLPILGILLIPLFFLLDTLVISTFYGRSAKFSLCSLLLMHTFFTLMNAESLVSFISFIMRGWWQITLLYLFLIKISRIFRISVLPR